MTTRNEPGADLLSVLRSALDKQIGWINGRPPAWIPAYSRDRWWRVTVASPVADLEDSQSSRDPRSGAAWMLVEWLATAGIGDRRDDGSVWTALPSPWANNLDEFASRLGCVVTHDAWDPTGGLARPSDAWISAHFGESN
ncbi:hypothetical protein FB384_004882 [Prauserella sediminis]|uniref:Uncharacterized protein n=1 Tax=Prauserella sediminis TaxID=577680 RepID=A0A839XZW3_9PSEU|nr:hypothetical protein [Prauserella sediminis]MBB3665923.1 hypothetical protein [Prauserella sediminis]